MVNMQFTEVFRLLVHKTNGICAEVWSRETAFVVEIQVRYLVFVRAIVSLLTGRKTMPCKRQRRTPSTLS